MGVKQTVFIALGSNIGDRGTSLKQAIQQLSMRGVEVVAESQVLETEPEGFESEHLFLNQVVEGVTAFSPSQLLEVTQEIERELGRSEKSHSGIYKDRSIDLDLILYGDKVVEQEGLTIPHPRFRERLFVLKPLEEIAPNVVDPVTGKTIQQLLWDAL